MKKILMIMKYKVDSESRNTFPKFDYQIKTLENMGFNVYYILIKGNKYFLKNNFNEHLILEDDSSKSTFGELTVYANIYKASQIALKNIDFDYIYMRYMPINWSYFNLKSNIQQKDLKVILEMPTYPIEKEINQEKRLSRKIFFKLSNYFFKKNLNFIDLFAVIGEKTEYIKNIPAINIENGIYVQNIKKKERTSFNNEIRLLGLANLANWHGYDRLINLVENSLNHPTHSLKITIVGNDADGSKELMKKMVLDNNLEAHFDFKEALFGEELDKLFDINHIAIGSLGLYRIGFESASTLKIREYIARGIPIIKAGKDSSIDDSTISEYIFDVKNNDSEIEFNEIVKFYQTLSTKKDMVSDLRSYSEKNLTWEAQFIKVFNKL